MNDSTARRTGELRVWGRRLHYVSRGEGPPVLLLHGLGATSHVWDQIALPGYRLIAVDLPGSGWSEVRAERLGPRELSELMDDFVQKLAPGPYGVVGHSLGALVALEMALLSPRARGAVLINAPLRLPAVARIAGAPLLGDAVFRLSALAPVSRTVIRLYLTFIFGDRRKVTPNHVDAYARVTGLPGYHQAVLAGLRGLSAWAHGERLSKLAVPCTVIWGERDRLFPLALGRQLANLLPNATFHPLKDCGHSPPEEAPAEVSAIAQLFFDALPAAPAAT